MSTTHHPLLVFKLWHHKAIQSGRLRHPYAACLSTVDCDGRPNARIIDLKDVTDHSFIFGTSLQSRKAREIAGNEAVSLTFWWDNIGCQVRACGSARELSPADSDQLFAGRSRHSKLATLVSRTGKAMSSSQTIDASIKSVEARFRGKPIARPDHWSGFEVIPARIEFFAFKENRLHERILYEYIDSSWQPTILQP